MIQRYEVATLVFRFGYGNTPRAVVVTTYVDLATINHKRAAHTAKGVMWLTSKRVA